MIVLINQKIEVSLWHWFYLDIITCRGIEGYQNFLDRMKAKYDNIDITKERFLKINFN